MPAAALAGGPPALSAPGGGAGPDGPAPAPAGAGWRRAGGGGGGGAAAARRRPTRSRARSACSSRRRGAAAGRGACRPATAQASPFARTGSAVAGLEAKDAEIQALQAEVARLKLLADARALLLQVAGHQLAAGVIASIGRRRPAAGAESRGCWAAAAEGADRGGGRTAQRLEDPNRPSNRLPYRPVLSPCADFGAAKMTAAAAGVEPAAALLETLREE